MENEKGIIDSPLETQSTNGLSGKSKEFLKEIAKWSMFLSIVGFVMVGLMIVGGIFAGVIMSFMGGELGVPMESGMFGGIYIIMALIYFFPIFYLYRFSTNMKLALQNDNEETIDYAFENLKSHYKFIGIFMAITLIIYGVVILVAALAGIFA